MKMLVFMPVFAAMLMIDAPTVAQALGDTTASTQQLANGYLGDRNDQIASDAFREEFAQRAARAISIRDYAGALVILRQNRPSANFQSRFLAGEAYSGLGDFASARKEYGAASKMRRNFTAAQVALGLLEAQHGDKAIAATILQDLTDRQTQCAGKCRDAAELSTSVARLQAALK